MLFRSRTDRRPTLHYDTPLADTHLCDPPALLIPGDPAGSRLVTIMSDPDPSVRMPKSGGAVIDDQGVTLLGEWITQLTSCP